MALVDMHSPFKTPRITIKLIKIMFPELKSLNLLFQNYYKIYIVLHTNFFFPNLNVGDVCHY